ncbi:D-glycero-alpha-D-manno-heptose-1,7-bisphosphate 7-phosphatase [Chrysiogenes arsenatis]|uniref:D-glycero-alpha-D-manno-heptose-1,7-bisphosphate 7-phosphatase n=1 Tax=Chrysiogenes arsenatis TaxID=309797 RepID=UPI000410F44B|nr:HAD family hydrolase [Chrysiogenes arsenatis]
MNKRRVAIFVDRDGTINREVDYLHRIEDFAFETGAIEGLHILQQFGEIYVVTNQSGIGRGYYTEAQMETLHGYMGDQLTQHGITISGIYACPHHVEKGNPPYNIDCQCRKPNPGMLVQAAHEHQLDLTTSWIIGDKDADIFAGWNAGCRGAVLITTGHGKEHAAKIRVPDTRPFLFAVMPTLYEAAQWIERQQ